MNKHATAETKQPLTSVEHGHGHRRLILIVWEILSVIMILYLVQLMPERVYYILIIGFLIFAGVSFFIVMHDPYKSDFMREYAAKHGWAYQPSGHLDVESSRKFKIGYPAINKWIRNIITGTLQGRPVQICQYSLAERNDIGITFRYIVVSLAIDGNFPNVVLKRRQGSSYWWERWDNDHALKLPPEFNKVFRLNALSKYEASVFAIFTPEVLTSLAELKSIQEVELVGHKIYIYIPQRFDTVEALESRLEEVSAIIHLLEPAVERVQMVPVVPT